ncbi:OTU protein [Asimina triloba]
MEGIVVRRVIPSDNSCLFNAVGFVMDHDKQKASELRQVIAATVASDPTKYNEAFLGKLNEEYCAWILDSEKWGGAIELSILAEYYGREIAAYDIQTNRCDVYGQEMNYQERVMLIYDGLHYDALAMSPSEGAPEEFDQTIFPVQKDRTIGAVDRLALNLVKDAQRGVISDLTNSNANSAFQRKALVQICHHFMFGPPRIDCYSDYGNDGYGDRNIKPKKRNYTDTANFTLRCGVCQIGVIGQKEAVEHAQATGHVNFQEYR